MAQERLSDMTKLQKSLSDKKNFSSEHLTFYSMDMADFNDVLRVAKQFTSQSQKLDILLNNAGLVSKADKKTH